MFNVLKTIMAKNGVKLFYQPGSIVEFTRGFKTPAVTFTTAELTALHNFVGSSVAGTEAASAAVVLDADRKFDGGRLTRRVHSTVAASTALSATSATTFSTGTYTCPAAFLEAGDTLRFRATVRVATVDGTDSFQLLVVYAGATILDTTALAAAVATDQFVIEGVITSRTVHASTGTAYASTTLVANVATNPLTLPNTHAQANLSSLANAAAHTLLIRGAFGGAGNTAVLEDLTVWHN